MNEVTKKLHEFNTRSCNFPKKVHNSSFFINSELQETFVII